MIVKTSELSGAALDWLVARAEGKEKDCSVHAANVWYGRVTSGYVQYRPSTKWDHGGPIIECAGIGLVFHGDAWSAGNLRGTVIEEGDTPLIAAMRCHVASRLGDEVDVPEELLP